VTVIDYDSDTAESQTITTAVAPITNNNNSTTGSNNSNLLSTETKIDYATELLLLKSEIQALRTLLTATIEQIKTEIMAIHQPQESGAMEIEATNTQNTHQPHHATSPEISSLIHDLKHEIATFVIETRALLQHQSIPMMQQNHLASKTWVQSWTSVGLPSYIRLREITLKTWVFFPLVFMPDGSLVGVWVLE